MEKSEKGTFTFNKKGKKLRGIFTPIGNYNPTGKKEDKMENINISRSRSGLPCLGAGGGAMSNTCQGRFILRDGKRLADAIFVRQHGSLSNQFDQAIVPVKVGDVVVDVYGSRPVDMNNPNLSVKASRITGFVNDEATLEYVEYPFSTLPESVVEGLSQYHNRDGRYFIAP
jgi:hypothetical protein